MPSEKQQERARVEMENRHQKELLEMQEMHNKQKIEVMQELISGVVVSDRGQQAEQQIESSTRVYDTSTKSLNRDRKSPLAPKYTLDFTKNDSVESNSNPISKMSVACMPVALNANEKSLDRTALDAQKSAEIKALMRDKSLDRETRRHKLDDIKAKYSKLIEQAPVTNNAADSSHQRKMELQAIMKDRSLSREERLKRLAEVKNKYADAEPQQRLKSTSTGAKGAGRVKRGVSMPVENQPRKEKKRAQRPKGIPEESRRHEPTPRSTSMPDVEEDASVGTASQSETSAREEVAAAIQIAKNLHEETDTRFEAGSTQEDTVSSEEGDNLTELSSIRSRRRSSFADDHIQVNMEVLKGGSSWNSEPTQNITGFVKSHESHQKSITISEPSSRSTSARSLKIDPLEHAEVNKTPIKTLIRKLEKNDPSLDVLRLDGRGKIKEKDWETFFETLESNTTLTHLSLNRCGLTDDLIVSLILAIVENSTLTVLHLMSNKDVTDSKCGQSVVFVPN